MKKKYIYIPLAIIVFLAAVHYVIGFDHARDHVRELVEMLPWPKGKTEHVVPTVESIPGHYDADENDFVPDTSALPLYTVSDGFKGNFAMIRQTPSAGGHIGMIDKKGHIIVKPEYDDVYLLYMEDGEIIVIRKDKNGVDKKGIIDTTGKLIIPAKYDDVSLFSEGRCKVEFNHKSGYIDTNGKEVIPPIYLDALTFVNGIACVCKEPQKWGCIDKTGKVVVPLIYFDPPDFKDSVSEVQLNGKHFKINTKGKRV